MQASVTSISFTHLLGSFSVRSCSIKCSVVAVMDEEGGSWFGEKTVGRVLYWGVGDKRRAIKIDLKRTAQS